MHAQEVIHAVTGAKAQSQALHHISTHVTHKRILSVNHLASLSLSLFMTRNFEISNYTHGLDVNQDLNR